MKRVIGMIASDKYDALTHVDWRIRKFNAGPRTREAVGSLDKFSNNARRILGG